MPKKPKIDVKDFSPTDIALVIGETAQTKLQFDALEAKLNTELDAVRARYADKLQNLKGNLAVRVAALEQWGWAHKDLFENKRSMEFPRGTIGFRLGMWQVKTRKGFTWKKVVEVLGKIESLAKYLRTREPEVNKETLIEDREKLSQETQEKIGVRIIQEDAFFFDPKEDDVGGQTPPSQ